ncbi:MAG: hypothetical protein ABI604_19660, partial [Nitrospirota bacterium]
MRGPYRACTAHPLASARARQPRRSRTLLEPWRWDTAERTASGASASARGTDRRGQRRAMTPMVERPAEMKGPDATSARAGLTKRLRPGLALLRKT